MKTYSMNDTVYFKLTPKGKKLWEEDNKKWNKLIPDSDWKIPYIDKEWAREQLWSLFERFGNFCGAGRDVVITDITFDNPLAMQEIANDLPSYPASVHCGVLGCVSRINGDFGCSCSNTGCLSNRRGE